MGLGAGEVLLASVLHTGLQGLLALDQDGQIENVIFLYSEVHTSTIEL
jgi:hypothetical protein